MYSTENSIKLAKQYLGEEIFSNLDIEYCKVEDERILNIRRDGNHVLVEYGQLASLFFALTLIKQNIKDEYFNTQLVRNFTTNGTMHDCSRNGPLNIKQAKEMLLVSALFGLNRFMLYTEDVYEIEGVPYFGYLRGKYSKEELKDLVAFAKTLGVDLVPSIQTLSHLQEALKWPYFSEIADTRNTLVVNEPKTYELIDKMLQTCEECFDSPYININMDEAIDMASGAFIWKDLVLDKKELFITHLNRVVELCKKHNFKPIMWADMFFKLDADNSNGHVNWYTFKGFLSEKVEKNIPDVGLIYWDYYNDKTEVYDRMFKACKHTGRNVIFADGAISWTGFAPNIIQSLNLSKIGIKSAIKNNIKDIFITSWGDNGNECSVVDVYPAMALHSAFDFYGKCGNKLVSDLLETVTGDPLRRWALLQEINHVRKEQAPYENLSKPFLYQTILLGVADSKVKEEYSEHFKEVAKKLNKASKQSKKYGYVYKTLAALSDLLANKATIGLRLRKTYKNGDKESLIPFLNEIKLCIKKLDKFLEIYRIQWHTQNKPFGFEIIDGRLGYLRNSMNTAYLTIKDYLDGKIEIIAQLEEDILPWHDTDIDDATLIGYFEEIASTNTF